MAKTPETIQPQVSFESAIERLESIVEQMESDKMPLEELLIRYEEGLKLVQFCSERLTDAEKRIEIISRNAGGKPTLTEFEPSTAKAKAPADEKSNVSLF